DRPNGERSFGDRSFGDRPRGERTFTDRPAGFRHEGPRDDRRGGSTGGGERRFGSARPARSH
ncbi:MAG TPA: hypothetical protein VF657_02840, partial [Actinoplanes sp.]